MITSFESRFHELRVVSLLILLFSPLVCISQVSSTQQTNTRNSTARELISSDSVKSRVFDYWTDKYKDVLFRINRYSDGTTYIMENSSNWFQIKTEYVVNEFTGEKTDKLVDVKQYLPYQGSNSKVRILQARKDIFNGFLLQMKGRKMKLTSPLGISYMTERNGIITSELYSCWNSPSTFELDFKTYFGGNNPVSVIGIHGNTLIELKGKTLPVIGGREATGGYYDEKTNIVYYVLKYGGSRGVMYRVVPLEGPVDRPISGEELFATKVVLVPSIPGDKITRIIDNEKVNEVYYENGDYVKVSKLKNGKVYDCKMHRPNGLWTVKLNGKMEAESKFEFSNDRYKDLVYKGEIKNSICAQCLADEEMLDVNQMRYPVLYSPKEDRILQLSNNGDVIEYVEEQLAREQKAKDAIFVKKAQAIYQSYCNKYGKQNVDKILNDRNITVGMPISVIKALCHCTMTDESSYTQWYRVWFSGYEYDINNNCIKKYETTLGANVWYIGVSNNIVKYVGNRSY